MWLVEALTRLRLVNRSNLGVARMFSALLMEGKEPPIIDEQGEAVKVTFLASELSVRFRVFVAEAAVRRRGPRARKRGDQADHPPRPQPSTLPYG